jgi:tetratricopeptide (TPR) repeat protein
MFRRSPFPMGFTATLLLAGAVHAQPRAAAAQAPTAADSGSAQVLRDLNALAEALTPAAQGVGVIETQFAERLQGTPDEVRLRHFSNGEIQHQLGDYAGAAVYFYELVSDPGFQRSARYDDALFLLGDALYQQGNIVGAKRYLEELLDRKGPRYRDALARYLEIATRRGDFSPKVETFVERVREKGALPPEIGYPYGKWIFRNPQLPVGERIRRCRAVLGPIASSKSGLRLPATYFLAVAYLSAKDVLGATEQLKWILKQPTRDERDLKVREHANLALARIHYDTGDFDRAIERYQEIPQGSENYPDALYEQAWAYVRKENYAQAKNLTDLLLIIVQGSPLAPDAEILQAHLLLKLQKFREAKETYARVIETYKPVRERAHEVTQGKVEAKEYVEKLLSRDKAAPLDPGSELMVKMSAQQRDVGKAVELMEHLEGNKQTVQESQDLIARLLDALEKRPNEVFPLLQDGYTQADALDSALTRIELGLLQAESQVLDRRLEPAERTALTQLRRARLPVEKVFATFPKTLGEVEARRSRLRERADRSERSTQNLSGDVQGLTGNLEGLEQWLAQANARPDTREKLSEQMTRELESLGILQAQLDKLGKRLKQERSVAGFDIAGEEALRQLLDQDLEKEHALLVPVEGRAGVAEARLLDKAHALRERLKGVRARVTAVKQAIREQVTRKGRQVRDELLSQQEHLQAYQAEVARTASRANDVVGAVALDSFRKVEQQFYDLVLKADVGMIDVAFGRKQDNTSRIQTLSFQRDRELRRLDDDFKEVLKDTD